MLNDKQILSAAYSNKKGNIAVSLIQVFVTPLESWAGYAFDL